MGTGIMPSELTKTEEVLETLEREITSGKLEAGERLPSMRVLAERFEVSTTILVRAVKALEKKGLVNTRERSRITVAANAEPALRRFALFTTVTQGNMDSYFDTLLDTANRNNLLAMPMTPRQAHWKKDFRRLLDSEPFRVALDLEGQNFDLEQVYALGKDANLLFFNRFEWEAPLPENGVLTDYTAMTCHTLKHFLDRGHRKIVFLGHWDEPRPFKLRELTRAGELYELEFKSEAFDYCCWRDFENNPERVRRIFGAKEPPTAIFSRSDSILFDMMVRVCAIYPKCSSMERIGCHNSIWSRLPGHEFSTYQLDFAKMWDMAIAKKKKGVEWVVPAFLPRTRSAMNSF